MIEIFIDKVNIFLFDEDEKSTADKNLIIKVKFGPKVQFIIKEGQLAPIREKRDDTVSMHEDGHRQFTRTIRIGKSYLFPSYPDTLLMILNKFPLEVEVWNDDENEEPIFVGIGTMQWDTKFYFMLKETADICKLHEPLSIKQVIPIMAECCCKQCGTVSFILRLSPLGDSIMTEFQQLLSDPDIFVFRTNKAPSMFQCKRIEGDDPNFCMAGSLYETATLEDPDYIAQANKKIEVCTELQSCGVTGEDAVCMHDKEENERIPKEYPLEKIRMGDITGPCGNANCPLAHKVRNYIRNLNVYKKETAGAPLPPRADVSSKKICGSCSCADERWHRDECPDKDPEIKKGACKQCGGAAPKGESCDERKNKMFETGATPIASVTKIDTPNNPTTGYMFNTTKSIFGKDYIVGNLSTDNNFESSQRKGAKQGCSCGRSQTVVDAQVSAVQRTDSKKLFSKPSNSLGKNTVFAYNAETSSSKKKEPNSNFCLDIPDDKDCKCKPTKPSPPCKTFDCECMTETVNIVARKTHKPYCPRYKHRVDCPVTMMNEEEEKKLEEFETEEAEPLPYGLPPIKLGPCPVLGRPCTVPDGFARMYKNAVLPTQPPSYSDGGKVCCSKEYERIKKALKEYMKYEKDHDYRCINQFNVDTEKRCCDKEQTLLALMGKGCCGAHKMALQDKFKDAK